MQVGGSSFDIPLPVQLSLPIDELQRRAEELEFSELLDQVWLPFRESLDPGFTLRDDTCCGLRRALGQP